MPLKSGAGSIRYNINELMGKVQSPSRRKAITTLARKHNITRQEAQLFQAQKIAQRMARK